MTPLLYQLSYLSELGGNPSPLNLRPRRAYWGEVKELNLRLRGHIPALYPTEFGSGGWIRTNDQ